MGDMGKSESGKLWESVIPATEPGVSLYYDIIDVAFRSCLEDCSYDISDLEKEEKDQLFTAILDVWTNWPADNDEAWLAAPEKLRSLAVAGGWEEWLHTR